MAPMKFLKLVKSKRFNTRVASFQSQFPSLRYHGILSKYTAVDFKVRSERDGEYLDIYAQPEVLAYVDNTAKSSGVNVGEYLKDSQGSIIGRSYYTYGEYKCVKFKNQTVVRDGKEVKERVCLEHENRMYAPKSFARKMKKDLVPENIMKFPKIKEEIREFKKIKDRESEKANSLLVCVQDLDALIERNEGINPQALKPKDYNLAWASVGRLLGAADRLKRTLLAEQRGLSLPLLLKVQSSMRHSRMFLGWVKKSRCSRARTSSLLWPSR